MIDKLEEHLRRFAFAKAQALQHKAHIEQIYAMFMPNRDDYDSKNQSPGGIHNIKLYDTTGVIAARTHIAQLHVGLTPIGKKWSQLEAGTDVPEVEKENANRLAQSATDVMFKYLEQSNFHLAMNEAYHDLTIGTGALVLNEGPDDNPFLFSAVPIPFFFPEEGPHGTIETVWREFLSIPFRNILRMWPGAKIPEVIAQAAKEDVDFKLDLIEGSVFDVETNLFEYVVIHEGTKEVFYKEITPSSQWIVFRGFKRANEVYGRGPADQALPTMQTLNQIFEDELRAAAFKSMPIFMGVSDGVFNPWTVVLQPNTIIPVSPGSTPQNPPLFPVPSSGDPKFSQIEVQDLRQQINKLFFTDPLGPVESPVKSATEMMIRNQESLEAKVPFIGRLQVELLEKLTQRMVYILRKKGLFPLVKVDGKELAVSYKTPLIESQNLAEANKIIQFTQTLQSIVGPEMSLMAFDLPDLITTLAEKMEVPLDVVKTNMEIQEAIAAMQEQAAQQQAQLPQAPTGGLQQ